MPSQTDLLNDALGQIGQARIAAIDDGTVSANRCQDFYPALRDAALVMAHWTFNTSRVELAQDVADPPFEFAFQYTLPADCLKVIEYNGANVDTSTSTYDRIVLSRYKIETGKLLTNDGTVSIRYLARVENPALWNALFYQGVAAQLAGKLASAILKDAKLSLTKAQEGLHLLMLAASIDGQQDSIEPQVVNDLTWGRW